VPTYEYACTACDHTLEAVQSFTDAALTECPVCGGALRKVFSAVGVVFKGSGFYKTDSRAKSSTSSESGTGSGSSEGAGAGSKTETKADSKSETKSEGKSTSKPDSKPAAATPASTPAS
jgi:putative FmdB family regulatory protein